MDGIMNSLTCVGTFDDNDKQITRKSVVNAAEGIIIM